MISRGSRHIARSTASSRLPFRAVNCPTSASYDPDLQRHHLIPRQAIGYPGLRRLFESLDPAQSDFEDFRHNGVLLPARSRAAARTGLPLHRGPHRDYNAMVIERLGGIELRWSRVRVHDDDLACTMAISRIARLQDALRRQILDVRFAVRFNRADPLGQGRNFDLLDGLAETLWQATGE